MSKSIILIAIFGLSLMGIVWCRSPPYQNWNGGNNNRKAFNPGRIRGNNPGRNNNRDRNRGGNPPDAQCPYVESGDQVNTVRILAVADNMFYEASMDRANGDYDAAMDDIDYMIKEDVREANEIFEDPSLDRSIRYELEIADIEVHEDPDQFMSLRNQKGASLEKYMDALERTYDGVPDGVDVVVLFTSFLDFKVNLAHEIGHVLGMQHDGKHNSCSSRSMTVMHPSAEDTSNWSQCSAEEAVNAYGCFSCLH